MMRPSPSSPFCEGITHNSSSDKKTTVVLDSVRLKIQSLSLGFMLLGKKQLVILKPDQGLDPISRPI